MIDLKNKSYDIEFETIWEDKCYVEILSDDFVSVGEIGNKTEIHDRGIEARLDREVKIKFKIP